MGATRGALPSARWILEDSEEESQLPSKSEARINVPTLISKNVGIRQVEQAESNLAARIYLANQDSAVRIQFRMTDSMVLANVTERTCRAITYLLLLVSIDWKISYLNAALQQEILDWPAGLQSRYIRLTDMMLAYGPALGMPHTRALGEGLFELRIKSSEGLGRVMYCTLVGKRIVMLHSFIKKTQKTPTKELQKAYQRLKQVKDSDEA
jgi:phage-related protein